MSEFKIYTKLGDKGETSLLGGRRVPKFHDRIEAYGTIDELNSFIGLIRDQEIDQNTVKILIEIQDRLFTIETLLATEDREKAGRKLPGLNASDITMLEDEIDKMNEQLPPLNSFILPGGHTVVSHAHVARTICRRAERIIIKLDQNERLDPLILKYVNRLSDYFFVLARKFAKDFGAEETPWKAKV